MLKPYGAKVLAAPVSLLARLAPAAVVVVAWAGCPASLDDPARFDNGECDPLELLREGCGGDSCHDSSNPSAGLDLVSPGFATTLIDKAAAQCSGQILIDSADPGSSYMLTKLDANPACGQPMPFADNLLTAAERTCLEQWVNSVISNGM